jgi:hypothetical protein
MRCTFLARYPEQCGSLETMDGSIREPLLDSEPLATHMRGYIQDAITTSIILYRQSFFKVVVKIRKSLTEFGVSWPVLELQYSSIGTVITKLVFLEEIRNILGTRASRAAFYPLTIYNYYVTPNSATHGQIGSRQLLTTIRVFRSIMRTTDERFGGPKPREKTADVVNHDRNTFLPHSIERRAVHLVPRQTKEFM